ncbi:hypothetical protein SIAM614_10453 [Stappia aggregata IAM 12614]|uniref:Peptidoglycan binding-like domain-containing protein n=1 Tax=Roseibium aggregatum (strain ATCC 25650 / DSM 13394 / JCM 20685 / NBRC 16684 / NCIMB 2208 / IAM 12614 / B1) TaxID=384765 RepID=A0NME8_ROSAI|nr:peptidoglycan-binding protein [Roseibium aggregatum]EAV46243.1 hypothetical protein SIAM614_10453 [Stappia aggregata IAM 12614] [Roseibium aggregatum IAM 12614]
MGRIIAQYGSKGSHVERIQKELNKFFKDEGRKPLIPDGDYGKNTKEAVIQLQKDFFLYVDGVVGEFTNAVLFKREIATLAPRPRDVTQGLSMRCWAASSESWLETRPTLTNRNQVNILNRLIALGGATPITVQRLGINVPNPFGGALRIPLGQTQWQDRLGLTPIEEPFENFYAEICASRLQQHGPLLLGVFRERGRVGHVVVMWGAGVTGSDAGIQVMDPARTPNSRFLRIAGIQAGDFMDGEHVGGTVITWIPDRTASAW